MAKFINGYAAVFHNPDVSGTEYELWPGAVERIQPTAFDSALKRREDVLGLFNHNQDFVLGRTSSGTLRLSIDPLGLRYEIDITSDSAAQREVVSLLRRRDVNASSFSFMLADGDARWRHEDGVDVREIHNVSRLLDVSVVAMPAYEATSASVRGHDCTVREMYERKIRKEHVMRERQLRRMCLREIELV